jgi:hypothetical protein
LRSRLNARLFHERHRVFVLSNLLNFKANIMYGTKYLFRIFNKYLPGREMSWMIITKDLYTLVLSCVHMCMHFCDCGRIFGRIIGLQVRDNGILAIWLMLFALKHAVYRRHHKTNELRLYNILPKANFCVLVDVHFYSNDYDTTRHDMTVIFVNTLRSVNSQVKCSSPLVLISKLEYFLASSEILT